MTSCIFDTVPPALSELVKINKWLNWKWHTRPNGKLDKPPTDAYGIKSGTNNPLNHRPLENAAWSVRAGYTDGIGFAPAADFGYIFIDLDDCIDPVTREMLPGAVDIIQRAGSYAEISPSGNGVRIIGYADGWNYGNAIRYYELPDKSFHGEMYTNSGYVTITFDSIVPANTSLRNVAAVANELGAYGRSGTESTTDSVGNADKTAPIGVVRETLNFIPNSGVADWNWWKETIGFALWAATEGSEEGREIWIEWSRQNSAYHEIETENAWERMTASPPERRSFGTLLYEARKAQTAFGFGTWTGGPLWTAWNGEKTRARATEALGVLPIYEVAGGMGGGARTEIGADYDDDAWKTLLQRGKPPKKTKNDPEDKEGSILGNLLNAKIALHEAPQWSESLAYDEFADRPMVMKPPPWGESDFEPREMSEHDSTNATAWMQLQGIQVAEGNVFKALTSEMDKNRFNRVKEYLDELVWDGVSRLDNVLCEYMGAEDTELTRAFSSKTIIAAVARIYKPGCQVKTVLTLEGPQDIGKSKFCAALVPVASWYTDTCPDIGSKDAMEQLRGIWIQEHSEMATLSKADASRTKAFLSTNVDRYRPSYGRLARDYPRQCIFIATVNPGSSGYLRDDTGGSRFWPVACGIGWPVGRTMDAGALGKARNQLWAEAVVRFRKGEAWWLDSGELKTQQIEVVDERYETDVWEGRVATYCEGKPHPLTTTEILFKAIGKDVGQWNRADQMRIGNILLRLGRKKVRPRVSGPREWRYVDPSWSGDIVPLFNPEKGTPEVPGWGAPIDR